MKRRVQDRPLVKHSGDDLNGEMAMNGKLLFEQIKVTGGLYSDDNLRSANSGEGWPEDTWFRQRLRYVREQQGKKVAEADVVYECPLGVITLRPSGGRK
jgi:hypothetical protein